MTEPWYTIKIITQSLTADEIEFLSYQLVEAGCQGIQVERAEGYLENHPNLFGEIPMEKSIEELEKPLELVGYYEGVITKEEVLNFGLNLPEDAQVLVEPLVMEAWYENWKAYYHVEPISRFITIVPEWLAYEPSPNEHVIYLDPGISFGTGNHPTTRLAAQFLELYMRAEDTVIDLGAGSGILSFIAATMGASKVRGYDIDPQAVESAQANLKLQEKNAIINKLIQEDLISFRVNDLLTGVTEAANIIVANILPHILTDMLGQAQSLLLPGGYLILGGILEEKMPFIEAALEEHQYQIIQRNHLKGWVSYVVQKEA